MDTKQQLELAMKLVEQDHALYQPVVDYLAQKYEQETKDNSKKD